MPDETIPAAGHKFALTSPDNVVFTVVNRLTLPLLADMSAEQITDEQAALVEAGKTARPMETYKLIDGKLMSYRVWAKRQRERIVTKLTLMERLEAGGKWTRFKAVLASMPELVQDAWLLSQDISDRHPMFAANRPALQAAMDMTEEQIDELFD